MINKLFKLFFKKQILLYDRHRNIEPLINDENRANYIFLHLKYIWLTMSVFGKSKTRDKAVFIMLNIISPKAIISMNWISKRQLLYYLWAKKTKNEFIVVQHGSYVGGKILDISHKYSKCTIMLCWSPYFKGLFSKNNSGKNVTFIDFGNTLYNASPRSSFEYNKSDIKKILIVPTFMPAKESIDEFILFVKKLESIGIEIYVKQHNLQRKRKPLIDLNILDQDIYDLLASKKYDLIISDHSSCLLDAIYFKNKVIYRDASKVAPNTIYNEFLKNMFLDASGISIERIESYVNIESQELLFEKLASGYTKENAINFL